MFVRVWRQECQVSTGGNQIPYSLIRKNPTIAVSIDLKLHCFISMDLELTIFDHASFSSEQLFVMRFNMKNVTGLRIDGLR